MPAAPAAISPSPEDGAERRERASGFVAPPLFWRRATPAERLAVGLAWGLSLLVCVASGLATVMQSWSGLPLQFAGLTLYVTIYPPLLIACCWTLAFSWWWGAPLVYASSLSLALYAGMPPAWALLFACANPLGLAVFAFGYRAVGMRLELRRLAGWSYFALLCFVSAVFGSAGALIWTHTNQVDQLGQLPIWQGWWLGGFLQQLLLVGPLMLLCGPWLARWRERRPALCPPPGVDPRRRALRLVLVIIVGVLGYGAATLGLAEARLRGLALAPDAREAAEALLSTAWAFYGVSAMVIVFIGHFGYQVFRHWSQANRRLLDALAEQARTDLLSGLLNRRAMEELLAEQLQRGQRHGEPAALLMVDIDHFKRINDEQGHAVGDEAIRQLADCLRATQRAIDRSARWGGEEFLLLLPQQDLQGALACAERIRQALAERRTQPPFTISIGVSTLAPTDESWDAWLRRADAALYRAKTQGRDRVLA